MEEKKTCNVYISIPFTPAVRGIDKPGLLSGGLPLRRAYGAALLREIESAAGEMEDYCCPYSYWGGGYASLLRVEDIGAIAGALHRALGVEYMNLKMLPGIVGAVLMDIVHRSPCCFFLDFDYCTSDFFARQAANLGPAPDSAMETGMMILGMHGFKDYGIRLMAGLPGQGSVSFLRDVERAMACGAKTIRLERLQLAPGMELYERYGLNPARFEGTLRKRMPSPSQVEDALAQAEERLERAGYRACRPGRYALEGYRPWVRFDSTGREGIGFGLGAASRYDGIRYHNTRDMDTYLRYAPDISRLAEDIEEDT